MFHRSSSLLCAQNAIRGSSMIMISVCVLISVFVSLCSDKRSFGSAVDHINAFSLFNNYVTGHTESINGRRVFLWRPSSAASCCSAAASQPTSSVCELHNYTIYTLTLWEWFIDLHHKYQKLKTEPLSKKHRTKSATATTEKVQTQTCFHSHSALPPHRETSPQPEVDTEART